MESIYRTNRLAECMLSDESNRPSFKSNRVFDGTMFRIAVCTIRRCMRTVKNPRPVSRRTDVGIHDVFTSDSATSAQFEPAQSAFVGIVLQILQRIRG
jgi:hypothetical protein